MIPNKLIQKIERPNWNYIDLNTDPHIVLTTHPAQYKYPGLDKWFDEHVQPVNEMLEQGVVVYHNGSDLYGHKLYCTYESNDNTHKALLINIEKLEKKCPTCGK